MSLITLGVLVGVAAASGGAIAYVNSTKPTYPVGGPYTVVYSHFIGFTVDSHTGDSKNGTVTITINSITSGQNFGIAPTTLPYSLDLPVKVTATGSATVNQQRILYDPGTEKNVLYIGFVATGTGPATFTFSVD